MMPSIKHPTLTILMSLWLIFALGCSSEPTATPDTKQSEKPRQSLTLTFNGGPSGGTFNYFANKISSLITENVEWLDMLSKESGGSLDNLCALNTNTADMTIVYAGDAFLGRKGTLNCEEARLDKARSMAYLYGAPAQLVVRKDSGIESVSDLKGKVLAIGNPGSGAALAAERFLKHLGLWDEIDLLNHGYSQAAADFASGKVDGFWVLVGHPNASVIEAATNTGIRLLDLHDEGVSSGFYNVYPFYSMVEIPAATYPGQPRTIYTFQDAALWCASASLDPEAVYQSLKTLFSERGLKEMRKAHKAAHHMSLENGLQHISIPLHPGAVRFWAEQGMDIPHIMLP